MFLQCNYNARAPSPLCLWWQFCAWLLTECCELPPVFRFDAFLRRRGTDKCDVFAGELTELGACTLGWDLPDMVSHLFPAVLGAFLDDTPCRNKVRKCSSC